jgi:hypothetical protein
MHSISGTGTTRLQCEIFRPEETLMVNHLPLLVEVKGKGTRKYELPSGEKKKITVEEKARKETSVLNVGGTPDNTNDTWFWVEK